MDKQIPVYRTLKDGTRQKIFLSFRDIKSNYEFCKQEYKNLHLLNNNPKQNIVMDESYEIDDIEME